MKEIYKVVLKKNKINQQEKLEGVKETKFNFVIINHPLKSFDKKTIKKIKIDEGFIYIGDLKQKHENLKGSGFLSRFITKTTEKVKDFFSPRLDDYNNTTKKMLAKYGNIPIESMAIYRTPLPSLLSKAINILSLGQWNKLQKKYGFDKFYHLALVITLKSGKNIIVEKNEVIEVKDSYKTNSDTETLPIKNMKSGYTINYLLENARRQVGDDTIYFSYDPFTNNCQVFIKNILSANGYYGKPEEDFLFQNIEELVKDLNPITKRIMKGTTDIASITNKILGKGI